MRKKLKNIFNKFNNKENANDTVLNDFNAYNIYDDTQEYRDNNQGDVIETIERDISSKRVDILTPKHFNDVKLLADELNKNKVVLVDLSQLSKEDKRRVIDFVSGVIYINNGSQKKLEKEIFKIIIRK